jgi:hypothetical protein
MDRTPLVSGICGDVTVGLRSWCGPKRGVTNLAALQQFVIIDARHASIPIGAGVDVRLEIQIASAGTLGASGIRASTIAGAKNGLAGNLVIRHSKMIAME